MSETKTGTCKSCGARIVWVKMLATGKAMPCDDPGVLIVEGPGKGTYIGDDGRAIHGRPAGPEDANAQRMIGRVSHFATCPQAAEHRRAKA